MLQNGKSEWTHLREGNLGIPECTCLGRRRLLHGVCVESTYGSDEYCSIETRHNQISSITLGAPGVNAKERDGDTEAFVRSLACLDRASSIT